MLKWIIDNFRRNRPKEPLVLSDPRVTAVAIDADALKVVRRLQQQGCKAYVVGGAVRDLLLGIKPKDFDVVTSAKPADIRAMFRNAIIIGRRFKLAHIRFQNGKIIETATFRKHHGQDAADGPVDHDNVFGTEEDDAFRRDFTVNALFYDPQGDKIIDWTGGLKDLRARTLRSIGDPMVRLKEDPVRMLRAIKFSAKFNLRMEPGLSRAILALKDNLSLCSQRRLYEEFLKIMKAGLTESFVRKAQEYHFLDIYLTPLKSLHKQDADALYRLLAACDALVKERPDYLDSPFALLLWPFMRDRLAINNDFQQALRSVFHDTAAHFPLSKIEKLQVRDLLYLMPRFLDLYHMRGGKKRFLVKKVLRARAFPEALDLCRIIEKLEGGKGDVHRFWAEAYEQFKSHPA